MSTASSSEPSETAEDAPTAVPLLAPADGVPALVDSPAGVIAAAAQLAEGHGPLAVDAERASGFRYSQRAYLLQFRRRGAGTVLLDPIPVADGRELGSSALFIAIAANLYADWQWSGLREILAEQDLSDHGA